MIGHLFGNHVGVSARIPGPKAAVSTLGFIVMLPFWIIYIVVQGFVIGLLIAIFLAKVVAVLLLIVTFPVWAPVYWLWPQKKPKVMAAP